MRKLALSALFAFVVGVGTGQAAELVIKLRPPISIREHRTAPPSRRHVWVSGYHRWDGHAYVWEPGRYEVLPREHAVWVAPRYRHTHDGYVFVEGRWK